MPVSLRAHPRTPALDSPARSDIYWFAPHPAACALRPRAVYMHVWNDHHFVMSRAFAPLVMRRMLLAYTQCDGRFAHETPERWLHATLTDATRSAPPSTCTLRQLIFPLALVRRSAHEPDAWLFCAQNYILPYALRNKSATPCGGDASERALRKMHEALLACVRRVYPEEVIDSGFHKGHVVNALRKGQCPDWLRRSVSPSEPAMIISV
jgi:hypothetical protein